MATAEKNRTRILLVESDPWDAGLIQEAFDELDERPAENLLGRPVDLFHAETIEEALETVVAESYDLILIDLATGGKSGLHGFLRLRELASATPFVILTIRDEEPLALSAMREGAAGYLLKEDLDCLPLARALRAAFEHHHALQAREEMPAVDELTGLTSRAGFLYLGEMLCRLSARWAKPAHLSIIHLTGFKQMEDVFGSQARDLALIETSEMVRDLFPDADVLARTGSRQFAVLSLGPPLAQDLQEMTAQWVTRRTARPSAAPPLEYVAFQVPLADDGHSLAALLESSPLQAAAMQK